MGDYKDNEFEKLIDDSLLNNQEAFKEIFLKLFDFDSNQIQLLRQKITQALIKEPDNSNALTLAARIHYLGIGGPVNYPEAVRLYELAIEKGNDSAMTDRANMHHFGIGGGPVNYPEAVRLLEQAIEKGNENAMNLRAIMHKKGKGGPRNCNAAAKLHRQACMKGSVFAEARIAILSRRVNLNPASEAAYHICVVQSNTLWQKNPTIFLAFLASDELLTETERLAILATWMPGLPPITTIKDQASIDLLGEYYFQFISNLLGEQWKLNVNKRLLLLNQAISYLGKIPKNAKSYYGACHGIATHSYHLALENGADETAAFEKAQDYFHEGALGDDLCQTHYLQLLRGILRPEHDKLPQSDDHQKIALLEAEYVIRFIIALPGLINHAILVTDQKSNTEGSFLSTLRDALYGNRNKIIALRDRIAAMVDNEVLLKKNAQLTPNNIKMLAEKYLALINETKQQVPAGNYMQEVIQVLDKMATKIKNCIELHSSDQTVALM